MVKSKNWRRMVLSTVLKRRHSLKGVKLIPLLKRIRGGQPDTFKEFARISKGIRPDNLELPYIENYVRELSGEELVEIIQMTGREYSVMEARWVLHSLVIFANEVGQPKGQDLQVTAGTSSQEPVRETLKRKRGGEEHEIQDVSLEERLKSLEKSSKDSVNDLNNKVRCLCLQEDPSMSLILLTLEDLAKTARKVSHEEAEIYEELSRQASRYQTKLDISNLCLSVLGGKAADAISKAVAKCLKQKSEFKNESKRDGKKEGESGFRRNETSISPLNNLYPYYQAPSIMYSSAPGYFPGYPQFGGSGYSVNRGFRSGRAGTFRQGFRPRGASLFCESTTHQVNDCEKMKVAKGK